MKLKFTSTTYDWWCVVIIRELICESRDGGIHPVDDVVSVYGPFSRLRANVRADRFNARSHHEYADGEPYYAPVANAPAFLQQETWDQYHAIARPMNDILW